MTYLASNQKTYRAVPCGYGSFDIMECLPYGGLLYVESLRCVFVEDVEHLAEQVEEMLSIED